VADIFRRHGAAYREAHDRHLSRGQRRVMGAIETCRSAALGGHVEQCNGCGQLRVAYNSCRNLGGDGMRPKVSFAPDSFLEGSGFEL
jgi:hypothetical protein